jgi:RND family efflux transporter MFP subunit
VTDIPENYLNKVKRGTPVQILVPDLNNRIINSKISLISQSINPNSRGFLAEARIPNEPSLKPNQVAIVKIQDYAASNVIVVPVSILQTDETGKYTFVLATENGKQIARKRPVAAGEVYGEQIEIKRGLNPGDQVITLGYQGLYDGQVITTQN